MALLMTSMTTAATLVFHIAPIRFVSGAEASASYSNWKVKRNLCRPCAWLMAGLTGDRAREKPCPAFDAPRVACSADGDAWRSRGNGCRTDRQSGRWQRSLCRHGGFAGSIFGRKRPREKYRLHDGLFLHAADGTSHSGAHAASGDGSVGDPVASHMGTDPSSGTTPSTNSLIDCERRLARHRSIRRINVKSILIAASAALSFATPAAAQPAAAPAPTATCTPEHAAMGHCTLSAQPQSQGHQMPGSGHQGGQAMNHGQMECCRDANGNGKMDCCENMGAAVQSPSARQAPAAQPQAHQGH